MKTKTVYPPTSVMSKQLKALLSDPESAAELNALIAIIAGAPDAYGRQQRCIAIQAYAEILLRKSAKDN